MTAGRKHFRAAEIAALTGSSIRTVRRWIAAEILPSVKLGGARLVAIADLETLLSPSFGQTQQSFQHDGEHDLESDV
jgi:excisionase family DNA binding protein